jgi:hypothetical protein
MTMNEGGGLVFSRLIAKRGILLSPPTAHFPRIRLPLRLAPPGGAA